MGVDFAYGAEHTCPGIVRDPGLPRLPRRSDGGAGRECTQLATLPGLWPLLSSAGWHSGHAGGSGHVCGAFGLNIANLCGRIAVYEEDVIAAIASLDHVSRNDCLPETQSRSALLSSLIPYEYPIH